MDPMYADAQATVRPAVDPPSAKQPWHARTENIYMAAMVGMLALVAIGFIAGQWSASTKCNREIAISAEMHARKSAEASAAAAAAAAEASRSSSEVSSAASTAANATADAKLAAPAVPTHAQEHPISHSSEPTSLPSPEGHGTRHDVLIDRAYGYDDPPGGPHPFEQCEHEPM